jgi:hypothetical protein
MQKSRGLNAVLLVLVFATALTGCSLSYKVQDPVLSSVQYGGTDLQPLTLNVVDQRTGEDAVFLVKYFGPGGGSSDALSLTLENMEDPVGYFSQQLEKELNARKIPVRCVVGETAGADMTLLIDRYQIFNIRATGFSPYEACHVFAATLVADGRKTPIKAYFYNGKTPIWSMNEVEEPCFTIPVSIMVKEVASKINTAAFDLRAPDDKVAALTRTIDAETVTPDTDPYERPFWQVLELGYTNNPTALAPLKKYAMDEDDFFSACALSAMGTLGAEGELDFLILRYENGSFNTRYMAAKAIGDIGTVEALRILRDWKTQEAYESEGGLKNCLDLYAP